MLEILNKISRISNLIIHLKILKEREIRFSYAKLLLEGAGKAFRS